jgi:glycogen synthase
VLHVLDHSWPVLSGYSVRSRSLLRAQLQVGLQPQALTGPLHQMDDPRASDIVVDDLLYVRTPLEGPLSRKVITGHWPLLREAAVVRLLEKQIMDVVVRGSFDIIHAHSPVLCGLAAWQVAKKTRTPFVYEIRAFWEDAAVDQKKTQQQALRYRATRALEGYVACRADAVVGIAQHILQDLSSRGVAPQKLFHVSNGVDGDHFIPMARDQKLGEELGLEKEPVLGFVGSLYRYEGVAWLIRALSELRKRGTACKLMILGDGEDVPAIQAAIRDCAAQNYVLFMGRVPHEEVRRYYSVMDIMVYPRLSNRLTELVTPLKPLEAMALGKPVLASAVGGIRELMEHGQTALLFRPEDMDEFCTQARALIDHATLRDELGFRARQTVLREKDWKVLARKYAAVYEFASSRTLKTEPQLQDSRVAHGDCT